MAETIIIGRFFPLDEREARRRKYYQDQHIDQVADKRWQDTFDRLCEGITPEVGEVVYTPTLLVTKRPAKDGQCDAIFINNKKLFLRITRNGVIEFGEAAQ